MKAGVKMSSSEYMERLTLIDLETETPPSPLTDFTEQSEFPVVESDQHQEATPEEAFRKGVTEGERRGREAALQEFTPVLEELRTVTAAIASVRQQRLNDARSDLVEIAVSSTQQIIRGELEQSEEVSLRMVQACIEQTVDDGPLTLHVAPSDLETINAQRPQFEQEMEEGSLSIQADASLSPGNVVLETPRRCYDGRPERILAQAARQIGEGEVS